MGESTKIINVIEDLFRAGVTKDMSRLRDIQLDDQRFSSFSDLPPYDLKGYKETIELEELRFVSISDYSYEVKSPKISIYDKVAIVAAELVQTGMLVNNKAFTGEHMSITGRATFVLIKDGDNGGGGGGGGGEGDDDDDTRNSEYKDDPWKIVHIHLSRTDS